MKNRSKTRCDGGAEIPLPPCTSRGEESRGHSRLPEFARQRGAATGGSQTLGQWGSPSFAARAAGTGAVARAAGVATGGSQRAAGHSRSGGHRRSRRGPRPRRGRRQRAQPPEGRSGRRVAVARAATEVRARSGGGDVVCGDKAEFGWKEQTLQRQHGDGGPMLLEETELYLLMC